MTVVVAAQHADAGARTARAGPVGPAAVILHVEPARRFVGPHDLVDALTELRVRIRRKAGADAVVSRFERLAAVFAQVMSAGRDAEVDAIAVADDRVHAESAAARLPLACVLVIADPGHHLPRIAAVG